MPYDMQRGPDYLVVRKKLGRRWRVLHVYDRHTHGSLNKAEQAALAYLRALYSNAGD